MEKVIGEGKTTNEAIEDGLKKLGGISKDRVDVKVLESEDKRSFFSILEARKVKVELTLKEGYEEKESHNDKEHPHPTSKPKEKHYDQNLDEINEAKENIEKFLKEYLPLVNEELKYDVKVNEYTIDVNIEGDGSGLLIGYRGDTLNALQTLISAIADKYGTERIQVILDIEGYREKRAKTLEELAEKKASQVRKTRKDITLDPMSAFERKVIHTKLQEYSDIETYSIGKNENRRVVISLKK